MGIFPEGNRGAGDLVRFRNGAAYLALVSGAPIVPLMMYGTRPAGGGKDALPERGARRSTSCTARRSPSRSGPGRAPGSWWPRPPRPCTPGCSTISRRAWRSTGQSLPGPIPAESAKEMT